MDLLLLSHFVCLCTDCGGSNAETDDLFGLSPQVKPALVLSTELCRQTATKEIKGKAEQGMLSGGKVVVVAILLLSR